MPRLCDHQRLAHANDAFRLSQDRLDAARILVVAGDLHRTRRRLDLVKADDAAFRLRHHLLRVYDDVAVLDLDLRCDQLGEVVVLVDLRQAFDRDDAQLVAQGSPVMRMPACAL